MRIVFLIVLGGRTDYELGTAVTIADGHSSELYRLESWRYSLTIPIYTFLFISQTS